jgi:hypothetical protein
MQALNHVPLAKNWGRPSDVEIVDPEIAALQRAGKDVILKMKLSQRN